MTDCLADKKDYSRTPIIQTLMDRISNCSDEKKKGLVF